MKDVIIVGLTGGIASGKSTVSNYIKEQGFPVFDADATAHELMLPNSSAWLDIVNAFGQEIVLPTGEIDRKKLGEIVFANKSKLELLENILHKRIRQQGYAFIEKYKNAGYRLIVLDVPLLIEAGWYEQVNEVWLVHLAYTLQVERAMQRDGKSAEEIRKIIDKQMPFSEKKKYATHIIDNSGSLDNTLKQVGALLQTYRN